MNTLDARTLACPTTGPLPGGYTLSEGYYLIQGLNQAMHGMDKRGGVVSPCCRGNSKDRGAVCMARLDGRGLRGRAAGRSAVALAR